MAFHLSEGRLFRDYYGFDIVLPAVSSMLISLQRECCARSLRQSFSARPELSTGHGELCRVVQDRLHTAFPRTFKSMSFEDTLRMVNGKADDRTLPEPYLELDTHENQAILVTESLLKARAATWPRQLVTSALRLHLVLGMRTRVLHRAGKAVRLPSAAA